MRKSIMRFSFASIKQQIEALQATTPSANANITPRIISLAEKKLLSRPNHPLTILKSKI